MKRNDNILEENDDNENTDDLCDEESDDNDDDNDEDEDHSGGLPNHTSKRQAKNTNRYGLPKHNHPWRLVFGK